jgi:hypothetical protein
MKKRLLASIVLTLIAVAFIVFYSKPIILRTLLGGGRVLFPPINAEVRMDGEFQPMFRCFKTTNYSGSPSTEMIVLYDTKNGGMGDNESIIVDVTKEEAGLPNAGEENCFCLWKYILFQSESGAGYVSFKSGKFDPNEPKYVFEPKYIKFDVPSQTKTRTFEILLK